MPVIRTGISGSSAAEIGSRPGQFQPELAALTRAFCRDSRPVPRPVSIRNLTDRAVLSMPPTAHYRSTGVVS